MQPADKDHADPIHRDVVAAGEQIELVGQSLEERELE